MADHDSLQMPLVEVIELAEDYAFGGAFRIERGRLRFRRFDGAMSEPITRITFERNDAVGVLLYDPHDDGVILVRQFRFPVFAALPPEQQADEGARKAWLIEVIAGVQDPGYGVREVAHKEMLEESGYKLHGPLEHVMTFYVSPGGTSERVHLFYGELDHRARAEAGGGVLAEGEDTQVIFVPRAQALAMVASGEICDAKTIIALQNLELRRIQR